MELKGIGTAGTLESSDILITVENNNTPQNSLNAENVIELKSSVEAQFGKQIRAAINDTLSELGVTNAIVTAIDKGAMDCTIKARLMAAVYRANDSTDFNWEVKING